MGCTPAPPQQAADVANVVEKDRHLDARDASFAAVAKVC